MKVVPARSPTAASAKEMVESLQLAFRDGLQHPSKGADSQWEQVHWLRDEGRHGGGQRYLCNGDSQIYRGAINVSQVHYDDLPDKKLASANALSTIIHPRHPHAPSVHIHISFTEMRSGEGSFRMMADLNPAIENSEHTRLFAQSLQEVAPDLYEAAEEEGRRYFSIPALKRTRGSTHYYIEGHRSPTFSEGLALAQKVGKAATSRYCQILESCHALPEPDAAALEAQRAYHTLYLFQVLTLDRGTTSGLLVHNQNDLGIMGSLPPVVDSLLLRQWASVVPKPQDALVHALADALGETREVLVDDDTRLALAQVVRDFYKNNPSALALQARGSVLPPTVANHR